MSVVHTLQVLRCGDTWSFSGPLDDGAGNPLPLQNASITWKLKSLDGKTTYITLTQGGGISITNLGQAVVLYGPTAVQTSALQPGTYYDFLDIVLNDGSSFTLIEGLINALPPS